MDFAPDARRYALPPLLLAIPATLALFPLGVALAAFAVAVLWFYRDPQRSPPATGVVSPADGRVSVVRDEGERLRVGVFMNVTDVHVNRAPLSGTVREVIHDPGAHRPAFSKDSDRNERVTVACDGFDVVLIAGWFARRISPYVDPGDEVERGERIGHISFGSRADVLLPTDVTRADLTVEEGDTVRAGETVLARR
ncbi:MAG: protein sorting system archaetidylserine decarboxylase [Halobacteriaceae archaeon]